MSVLSVQEFQHIHCAKSFDCIERSVTEQQHGLLERFNEDYRRRLKISVFQHGPRRRLTAQNYVGIINLGRHQVEVLPKIECDENQVRRSLARMISMAMDLDLHGDAETHAAKHEDSVLEILIRLFCDKLWQAVRRGMLRRYESRADNLTVLRGRLSIPNQIRLNLARPDRLFCLFDEFTENHLLNQVLKAALRILHRVSRSQENLRNIAELLFCFQDVEDVAPASIQWNLVATDRLTLRYQPLVRLARLFIKDQSPDVVTGGGDGFALLFDMNELFESYVGAIARKVFRRRGLTVSLQGPARHLAEHNNGAGAFELRPDIVVRNGATVEFIIDTKWKKLDGTASCEGVSSSDVYQMHAYATQYATAEVVLLYPHHAKLGDDAGRRARYTLREMGLPPTRSVRRVGIATLDMGNVDTVPSQLEAIFAENFASAVV